jgi:hypothetical protein
MAFTGITALVAGDFAAATVLSAIAEIGTVMTVVGGITGSKDLLKFGGAMALVGGVGGMVNGAIGGATAVGADAAAAGAEGLDAASAAANTAGAAYEATGTAGGIMDGLGGADSALSTDAASAVTDPSQLTTPSQDMAQSLNQAPSVNPTDSRLADSTQSSPLDSIPGAQDPNGAVMPPGAVGAQAPITPYDNPLNPTDMRLANGTQTTPGNGTPVSTGSFLDKLGDLVKKNSALLQLGGGALKGMNDRSMWDQKMALEQQRVNQTSYGNTVASQTPNPRPGIISGARA